MKFNESTKNISNNMSPQRKRIYEESRKELEEIKEYLFDNFLIEDVHILEKFYSNDFPYINKLPIIFEMDYTKFCKLLDSKYLSRFENIDVYINSDNETYNISKDNIILMKEESFHYDQKYKTQSTNY